MDYCWSTLITYFNHYRSWRFSIRLHKHTLTHTHRTRSALAIRHGQSWWITNNRFLHADEAGKSEMISQEEGESSTKATPIFWRLKHFHGSQCCRASHKPLLTFLFFCCTKTAPKGERSWLEAEVSWGRKREMLRMLLLPLACLVFFRNLMRSRRRERTRKGLSDGSLMKVTFHASKEPKKKAATIICVSAAWGPPVRRVAALMAQAAKQ